MYHRWVYAAIATALWPIAFTLSSAALSGPVFTLYEQGSIARSPMTLITLIMTSALVISLTVCLLLWSVLVRWGDRDVARRRNAQHLPSH